MSVQATSYVIENSKHKGSALLLLIMIANHAHADGTNSFPSIRTLARETRMSERQIKRLLQELEASGELFLIRSKGRKPHSTFVVVMPCNRDILSRLDSENSDNLSSLVEANRDNLSPFKDLNGDTQGKSTVTPRVNSRRDTNNLHQPLNERTIDQLIDACALENEEVDRRLIEAAVLRTMVNRLRSSATLRPIRSMKYFDEEILAMQREWPNLNTQAFEAMLFSVRRHYAKAIEGPPRPGGIEPTPVSRLLDQRTELNH